MFSNDIHLIISIFQRDVQLDGEVISDPVKYVERYDEEIKTAGLLFEYLGLAKLDAKSLLGWKPQRLFMDLIAERLFEPKSESQFADAEFIYKILDDAVFSETKRRIGVFGRIMLLRIGLLEDNGIEGDAATPRLLELFKEGHSRKYWESIAMIHKCDVQIEKAQKRICEIKVLRKSQKEKSNADKRKSGSAK